MANRVFIRAVVVLCILGAIITFLVWNSGGQKPAHHDQKTLEAHSSTADISTPGAAQTASINAAASTANVPIPSGSGPSPQPGNVSQPPVSTAMASGNSTGASSSNADHSTSGSSAKTSPGTAAAPAVSEMAARISAATTASEVLKYADLTQPGIRALAVARMSEIAEAQQESALEKAARLGIPTRIDGPGRKVSLLYDFRGDVPLYRTTNNVNAAISSGANLLRDQGAPYGLDGTGMKVAVWDEAKIRNTHQEFPNSRVTIKDSATTFSDHSTHVAGTIGATGTNPLAKGMAPKVSIDSYDWNSDYAEMTAVGAATATDTANIPISNHSYGAYFPTAAEYVPYMGAYVSDSADTDSVAASLPFYQIFWAAGNEQDYLTTKGGYQSITFNGLAKNVITIAAADDAVTSGVRDPAVGTLAYFSSEGPCDDGRIKPDLTANGVNLYSSVAFVPPGTGTNPTASNTSYDGTYSGTSMATPNAAGSSILLEQLYGREFPGQLLRASMLKALLIETADDVGRPGPDYQYGWGYINVKAAADLILAHKASLASPKLIEGTLTNASKIKTHTFAWNGTSPIRATLCWTDPAGAAIDPTTAANPDSRTPNLVHDLNLKITAPDGTTTLLPYVMPFVGNWTDAAIILPATTGINHVDNVEQVYVATPTQAGNYTVTVSLTGSLTTASQVYSLVISGGTSVEANPAPVVTLDSPTDGAAILPNVPINLAATATDKAVGGAAGIIASVQFFNGATSLGVVTSAPYTLNWTPPAPGAYTLTAKATDTEGAAATSAEVNITVLSGNGSPSISSFSPASGVSGDVITITGVNFAAVSAVKFNGVDAQFTVVSPTSITANVPATATTGTITVTTSFGTATSASQFVVVQNPVLISQVYGAGGNSGATYNADYVELYNRSENSVSVSGWSVQYASASGTSWQTAVLTGSMAPGKYYLVKLSGGATGAALPTADATGTINMSGSTGKVALRNTSSAFTGSGPIGQSGLQDFVGYGTATTYEGSGTAPSPSATVAIFRAGGGATDSGDNSADFSTGTPNPRNSAAGSLSAPAISSATTASGVVGQAFSYQITATNSPISFAATGLPAGLSINTSTGLISGTPGAAGTSNATISATNAAGTGNAALTITVTSSGGGGGTVTVFSENMGTPSTTTAISSHVFQNTTPITFAGTADMRATAPSSGYTGASGNGNVFITNTVGRYIEISGINTLSYTGLSLSFGHMKTTVASSNELVVEVSSDGTNYTALTYSRATGTGTANIWALVTPTGTIPSTANLRIKFRQTNATPQFRIDDVVLVGTSAATPIITTTGTLAAVDTTYGTASPTPTSFTVSGANMTAAIIVTAPPGFEVSQTSGGTSGYAATQTIGAAGTIASTTVYVRLAANTAADSYAGNVVCSSTGAASVSVPTATSIVQAKPLTITAQDRTKPFGTTLTLGTTAFTPAGLVLGETIGGVTLAAGGGTATYDALGTYQILASNATGGTFTASNYDISYQPGTLTVTGQDYSTWISGKYSGLNAATGADPEGDGASNLVEFFMGLDPALGDATGATSHSLVGDQLSFTYRKSKSVIGSTGVVKWKNVLSSATPWSSAGITDVLVSDQGAYEIRKASVTVGVGENTKFLHLEITTP